MSFNSTFGRQRAFWDTLTICVFLGLLVLPTVDHFFNLDHAPETVENRRPAQWPRFEGILESRDFISAIENYFNDHFGFRKRLVRWNNRWKGQLFHDARGKDVLIGRDGWLYYSGCDMLEYWTRRKTSTEQDLANWQRLLEMRRDWLRERGCKYLLVVPPDKHSIYPEYLPDWMQTSGKPSKIQQLAEYMKTHSTVELLDLGPTLIKAKSIRVNYLKTDTHWNSFGGFVGYRTLVETLARQMPGLEPLPMEIYQWKPQVRPPGDLTKLLGRTEGFPETTALLAEQSQPLPQLKVLYDSDRFLPRGPSENRTCYTINEAATGKLIVFHDSFARRWYPLLGQHFREVIYVWHEDWDRPLLEREKPDVVVDEILERFFNLVDPIELANKDHQSETNAAPASLQPNSAKR